MASSKTIVLITGANQGIGLEIAKKARHRKSYILRPHGQQFSSKVRSCNCLPSFGSLSLESIELDVTSDSSISKAVTTVRERNMAVSTSSSTMPAYQKNTLPEGLTFRQQYTQIIDANTISAACVTDVFIPLMRNSSEPRIIFMSSGVGSIRNTLDPEFPYHGYDALEYKASKAAMNMILAI